MTRRTHIASPGPRSRLALAAAAVSLAWCAALRADEAASDDTDHLKITGTQRTRYERLDPQFRNGFDDSDQVLALQTTGLFDLKYDPWELVAEIMDSRGELNDEHSFVNGTVDALEPIQAYVAWHENDVFSDGSDGTLRVGRMTLDLGKRRLIARNHYRNTVNNFLGADWAWRGSDGSNARFFYFMPMMAVPSDTPAQLDNDPALDHTIRETRIIGAYYQLPPLADESVVETYLLAYDVNPPRNDLIDSAHWTAAGARAFRPPPPGGWGYEVEGVWEWGRAGGTEDGVVHSNLEQNAYLLHLEVGYAFEAAWHPTLLAQYDYASGDKNPNDSTIERFASLFGSRRFDFGPTNIYGPIARSNIDTPGLRVTFAPSPRMQTMFSYRWFKLADAHDQWIGSGWGDPTGQSGRSIGTQLEGSFTWTVIENRLAIEPGFAHLWLGHFARAVQGTALRGDPLYFYLAVTTTF